MYLRLAKLQLWRLFGTWSPTQWFGASRSGDPLPPAKCVDLPTVVFSTLYMDSVRICSLQPSQRGLPTAPQYIFEGLNSGALLMWLGRVRIDSKGLLAYWSELRRIVEERGYRAPRFSGVDLPEMVRQHPAGFAYYDQCAPVGPPLSSVLIYRSAPVQRHPQHHVVRLAGALLSARRKVELAVAARPRLQILGYVESLGCETRVGGRAAFHLPTLAIA